MSTSGSLAMICFPKPNWVTVISLDSWPSSAKRICEVRAVFSKVESMASRHSAVPEPFAGDTAIHGLDAPATQLL
jgi:hypothetical protein